MHRCQRCETERELKRKRRLLEQTLSDVQEAKRLNLTPQQRLEIEAEEQLFARLLEQVLDQVERVG